MVTAVTTCQTQDRTSTIESSRLGVVFFFLIFCSACDVAWGMNGSAWPFPMPCKVLDHVQQLWRLQHFCSQLVLALCRDSERIRDPSAGVAAAVEDPLSLTQAERRRREMQRPVKLCESKFWNLCPMKRFFSWILDTEHGLFFFLTGWAHYKNVFISSSSLKPGSPARQESGGRTLSITESGSATLQVVIAESWTMFLLSCKKGPDDASVWSCCMVWLSRPHN